jgi:hypothetical protein
MTALVPLQIFALPRKLWHLMARTAERALRTGNMPRFSITNVLQLACVASLALALGPTQVSAAPSAEVAKRCVHYAYIVYPFKRPGAVHMSGNRQAYVNDCFAKNGDVPAPSPPPRP